MITSIAIVSPALASFLSTFLLLRLKKDSAYLGAAIGVQAIVLWCRYLFALKSSLLLFVPFLLFPLAWIHGPLILIYIRLRLGKAGPSRRLMGFIGALAVSTVAVQVWLFHSFSLFRSVEAIAMQGGIVGRYTLGFMTCIGVYNAIFLVTAGIELRNAYSQPGLDRTSFRWMLVILSYFGSNHCLYLLLATAVFIGALPIPFHWIEIPYHLIAIFAILYFALNYPGVLDAPGYRAEPYSKQSLDTNTARAYVDKLETFMKAQRPFLDEDLSLKSLAAATGIPSHHLSIVLNRELGMNFFAYVSRYRVEAARELMQSPTHKDHTILSIAFEAGFQSKAAFNKAFKAETGMAPSEYRKGLETKGSESILDQNAGNAAMPD